MNLANDLFATGVKWNAFQLVDNQFSTLKVEHQFVFSLIINSAQFSSLNINFVERNHGMIDTYKCSEITLLSGLTGTCFFCVCVVCFVVVVCMFFS